MKTTVVRESEVFSPCQPTITHPPTPVRSVMGSPHIAAWSAHSPVSTPISSLSRLSPGLLPQLVTSNCSLVSRPQLVSPTL